MSSVLMVFDLSRAGEAGLIMFVLMFLAFTLWTLTRSRQEIDQWSEIPLEKDSTTKNRELP